MRELDTLVSLVKELQSNMQQIKTAQRLGGDGWIVYRTATGNTWDINATLTWPESRRWLITFTPDVDKQVVASIDFAEDNDPTITISGTELYRHFTAVPGTLNQWYYVARLDADLDADEAIFKAKFVVNSTSTGTLSIVQL
jgi:hypothetical protein